MDKKITGNESDKKRSAGAIGDIGMVAPATFDKISLIGGPVPLLCLSIIAFLDQLLGVWSLDMNQQDVWKFFAIARRALIVLLGWNYDVPTGRVGI